MQINFNFMLFFKLFKYKKTNYLDIYLEIKLFLGCKILQKRIKGNIRGFTEGYQSDLGRELEASLSS